MFDLSRRRAAGAVFALAASFVLVSCGGSDDPPPPPPLFSTTVAFGASLTDPGNACNLNATLCPPSPPYSGGRSSNGPLWVEVLAARYNSTATPSRLGGFNYAYAGARTGAVPGVTTTPSVPNMVEQLNQYLQRVNFQSNPQHLYVVSAAAVGNNISDALTMSAANPAQATTIATAVLTAAVTDIVTIINRLYASGARHIVVLNSTDVGRTPRVQAINAVSPGAAAAATQLSNQFNGALAQQIPSLLAGAPGLNLYLVDLGALTNEIVATPAAFGFDNITAPCFNTLVSPPTLCATPSTYVYWDPFHPTAATSAVVAQRAATVIGR